MEQTEIRNPGGGRGGRGYYGLPKISTLIIQWNLFLSSPTMMIIPKVIRIDLADNFQFFVVDHYIFCMIGVPIGYCGLRGMYIELHCPVCSPKQPWRPPLAQFRIFTQNGVFQSDGEKADQAKYKYLEKQHIIFVMTCRRWPFPPPFSKYLSTARESTVDNPFCIREKYILRWKI